MTPYMIFKQDDYLTADEPGVCNALVIEWLGRNGHEFKNMTGTFRRARTNRARGFVSHEVF